MGKGKKQARSAKRPDGTVVRLPKSKCCESSTRCKRCPIRMLEEGTLPEGYTVHKRRLVTVTAKSKKKHGKKAKKAKKKAA